MGFSNNLKNITFKKAQKNIFYTAESRFSLVTGFKFLTIPLVATLSIGLILYVFMQMNYLFFVANGFGEIKELEGAYFDYLLQGLFPYAPIFVITLIGFFFLGVYVSKILLRPFKSLTKYCEDVLDGYRGVFEPDEFSDLRLLTRISEFFFSHVESQTAEGKLKPIEIPEQFKRVHSPRFEKAYFLHFSLIIFITLVSFLCLTYLMTMEIHGQIVSLAVDALEGRDGKYLTFLNGQDSIVSIALYGIFVLSSTVYVWLAFHLYEKVSGGAFGIFSTLRSFMKGNFKARIHVIGYDHLRNSTRVINRYLDHIEKNYASTPDDQKNDNIVKLNNKKTEQKK